MITKERARLLRPGIEKAAALLPDADALEAIELFPQWKADMWIELGERIRYAGKLYRCEQAHTSQADWTPDVTPALWTAVAEPGEIPVWVQPTGAQDSYRLGDKVHYPTKDDPVYVSTIDYNVYSPTVAGWELA